MRQSNAGWVMVTRPQPGLNDTMSALIKLGLTPLAAPLLSITHYPLRLGLRQNETVYDRVVVTSSQSLSSLRAALPCETPLSVVGAMTAERAKALGFIHVTHGKGTAHDLVSALPSPKSTTSATLLLATGEGLGLDLAHDLRARGWRVTRRVVYRAVGVKRLSDHTRHLLREKKISAILFFSARTAQALIDIEGIDEESFRHVRALALSPTVASVLQQKVWRDIAIAETPTQKALLKLLVAPDRQK